jgi:hypothetical protein
VAWWRGGEAGQVLRRAPLPGIALFRYTTHRFGRVIGEHFVIRYSRVSRIVSKSECAHARRKT